MATIVACLINLSFVWLIVEYTCVIQGVVKGPQGLEPAAQEEQETAEEQGMLSILCKGLS
jgi:hypothetical protein